MIVEVRPAVPADAPAVLTMLRDLAATYDVQGEDFGVTIARIEARIDDPQRSRIFVAWSDDERVGFALCHVVPLGWSGVAGVYVEDLYVAPHHRSGRGAGRALMGAVCRLALDLATEDGDPRAAYVRLDAAQVGDSTAAGFFRRLGMTEANINFRLSGQAVAALATNPAGRGTPDSSG